MSKDLDQQIMQSIEAAVRDLNMGLPSDAQVSSDPDELLLGDSGRLSSLDTVNFLAIVEEHLNETMPNHVSLIERLMEDSGGNLPTTVRELARYIRKLY